MSAIRSLRLSHFRSYKGAEVTLCPGPVAIFGPNGAGKTNILEAISLFAPGRGLRMATPTQLQNAPAGIGWKLFAQFDTTEGPSAIVTGAEVDTPRFVERDDKKTTQSALAGLIRVLWLIPVMDRLWLEGASDRRRFLDRIVLNFHHDHGQAVLAYERAMRERNRLLKEGVRDDHWYHALEKQMEAAGRRVTIARRDSLSKLQTALSKTVSAFPIANLSLLDDSPLALADALRDNRPRDMAAGRSLIGPHRADLHAMMALNGIEARLCSTGEQKALLVSLILAAARSVAHAAHDAPILLLDEVTAHLDATRRAALFDEICALNAQVLMTGTGPELFAELGPRAQHLSVSASMGLSRIDTI